MNFHPETKVVRVPELLTAPVAEELVMFDVEQGKYFALNDVGTAIWARLEKPKTIGQLCIELQGEFEVPFAQCEEDVGEYLHDLVRRNLVTLLPEVV